jgi:hypothetical protein
VQLLFEDTLQPFVEVSCETAARRAGEPGGVVRGLGDLSRAHALLDESRARFEAAGDDPGLANVLVRLYLLRRRGPRGGAPAAIGGLELRTNRVTAATPPSSTSQRRVTSSGARATALPTSSRRTARPGREGAERRSAAINSASSARTVAAVWAPRLALISQLMKHDCPGVADFSSVASVEVIVVARFSELPMWAVLTTFRGPLLENGTRCSFLETKGVDAATSGLR